MKKKMNKRQRELKHFEQSKLLATIIVIWGMAFIQQSYILAFLGKGDIASELSIQVCVTIIGSVGLYFVKAFFGKYFQEKGKSDQGISENDSIQNDDEMSG